jgi:flagellar operon protein
MIMMNNIVTGSFSSIEQATGKFGSKRISANNIGTAGASSFGEILSQKKSIEEAVDESGRTGSALRFTKHAGERLEQRDIQLSQEQMTRLEEGTQKANSKGIKESLVLLDDMAFIVNTQSRTVITAMYQESGEDNIYTNIDGAVII